MSTVLRPLPELVLKDRPAPSSAAALPAVPAACSRSPAGTTPPCLHGAGLQTGGRAAPEAPGWEVVISEQLEHPSQSRAPAVFRPLRQRQVLPLGECWRAGPEGSRPRWPVMSAGPGRLPRRQATPGIRTRAKGFHTRSKAPSPLRGCLVPNT